MAYLTKYTFSKLCKKIDVNQDITLELFIEKIYNNPRIYRIFNKFEIKYLFIYKLLLEDSENFEKTYYREVPERIDTKKMVFEKSGKLKYHLFNNCKLILNKFLDFNIPPEITALGNDAVDEFRNWFKSQGYAEAYYNNKLEISKVVFDYNMKYPVLYREFKVPVLNENYKLITELDNTSNSQINISFDYETFLNNLEHLLNTYDNKFPCRNTKILSKFDYLINKSDKEIYEKITELFSDVFVENFGMSRLKNLFKDSKNIKYDLISNLLEYFKWTFNLTEKNFENITLEKFGLECCGGCKKDQAESQIIS